MFHRNRSQTANFCFQTKNGESSTKASPPIGLRWPIGLRHIAGDSNITADLLSRIQTISRAIDYTKMAASQQNDPEIQRMLNEPDNEQISIKLKLFTIPGSDAQLYCDYSTSKIRPYVPTEFRQQILANTHGLSHSGSRATIKLMISRFVWLGIRKDTVNFVRNCIDCQRAKVSRHTKTAPARYDPPTQRFAHINIDIVGPFDPCEGQIYCLTMMDRFTRWPEAMPMPDKTAETVARAIQMHWISRFGVPTTITSDQGRQFESAVFSSLMQLTGTDHLRTTPYHAQSNGLIERWHRTFKAAILCRDKTRWVQNLPAILLMLRVAHKPDIDASPAELVYGSTLKIPGEFFNDSTPTKIDSEAVNQFRESMRCLRPTNTAHHSIPKTFESKSLSTASHVFVRNDSVRPSLSFPYDGPFKVIKRRPKFYTIFMRSRNQNISVDRLKPAFTSNDELQSAVPSTSTATTIGQNSSNSANSTATNTSSNDQTMKSTRSGRRVIIPSRFK